MRGAFLEKTKSMRLHINLYDKSAFQAMRCAGNLAACTLDFITPHVSAGCNTGELDRMCEEYIRAHDAVPAPLNYRGFPKSTCISVNHVVCHGIPNDSKVLREGDIANIDVTVILDGWHGDASRMYWVGNKISVAAERLTRITYESLMVGVDAVRPGNTTGDIGAAIQQHAEKGQTCVVRDFCGHGIGRNFHEAPNILHYGKAGEGLELQAGMIFTIEPMINQGNAQVKVLPDGWTAVTRDRKLSAQFEHTVGVVEGGCEVFTFSPRGWHCPPYAV